MTTGKLKSTEPTAIKCTEDVVERRVGLYLNMALMSPPMELHTAHLLDLLDRGNDVAHVSRADETRGTASVQCANRGETYFEVGLRPFIAFKCPVSCTSRCTGGT